MKKEKDIGFDTNNLSKHNISLAFTRLLGPLSIVTVLDSYKEIRSEYIELFSIILNWAAEYEIKKDLSLINQVPLLDVYYKLDKLKEKCLFDLKMGEESELADEIVIWYEIIMYLRKTQLEMKGEK